MYQVMISKDYWRGNDYSGGWAPSTSYKYFRRKRNAEKFVKVYNKEQQDPSKISYGRPGKAYLPTVLETED